eukprot:7242192-Prymnesium_polylepis.1
MTSEAKALEMIGICREVIAEVEEQDSQSYRNAANLHCSADRCLSVEEEVGQIFEVCARCRLARYCSKACQTYDWKHGGHKHECRMAQPVGASGFNSR